jgi:uncharacterized membrane protein YeiH
MERWVIFISPRIHFDKTMESFSVIEYISHNFTVIIDHLGTFAFAISGFRLAVNKQFDWFGAYVVGFITAIGGGTVRDLLLGVTPFWMLNASYLIVTAIALISFVFLRRIIERMNSTIFLFDAIGLGLFTVVGIEKSLDANYPFWIAIIMGMITGSVGGVLRDIAINEIPLIFRREIYALACVAGGLVFTLCYYLGLSLPWTNGISATTVIVIRILANRFHVQLPTVK